MGTELLNLLVFYNSGSLTIGIAVDDFNNDGRLDIGTTTNANSDTVSPNRKWRWNLSSC